MKYLKGKAVRDFGAFSTRPDEKSRPLPQVIWDAEVIYKRTLTDLMEIALPNYNTVA